MKAEKPKVKIFLEDPDEINEFEDKSFDRIVSEVLQRNSKLCESIPKPPKAPRRSKEISQPEAIDSTGATAETIEESFEALKSFEPFRLEPKVAPIMTKNVLNTLEHAEVHEERQSHHLQVKDTRSPSRMTFAERPEVNQRRHSSTKPEENR